jgi:hypothetical protein
MLTPSQQYIIANTLTLGERVTELRIDRGLTRYELGVQSRRDECLIGVIEELGDDGCIRLRDLQLVAKALGVSVSDLLINTAEDTSAP